MGSVEKAAVIVPMLLSSGASFSSSMGVVALNAPLYPTAPIVRVGSCRSFS